MKKKASISLLFSYSLSLSLSFSFDTAICTFYCFFLYIAFSASSSLLSLFISVSVCLNFFAPNISHSSGEHKESRMDVKDKTEEKAERTESWKKRKRQESKLNAKSTKIGEMIKIESTKPPQKPTPVKS